MGLNSGGGTVPLAGSVDFVDSDGNVSTFTVTVFTSSGSQISTSTSPAPGVSGFKSGPLDFSFNVNTTTVGDFAFQVYVTDSGGAKSNTLSGSFAVRDVWQATAAMPTARDGLVTAAVNDKIYAIGGNTESPRFLNTTEEYDPATNLWFTGAPMPTARSDSAVGVVDGKIYVIGGYLEDPTLRVLNTVEEYDPVLKKWTVKSPMPTARGEIAAAVVGGKIYVMGGTSQNTAGILVPLDTVEEYDPAADTGPGSTGWRTVAAMPTARFALAAAAVNGKIYALGGKPSETTITDRLEEYDPATNTWTVKAPVPTARYDLSAEMVNGKIYTIGGWSPGLGSGALRPNDTVQEYDPATNTWKSKTYLYPPGRHDLGLAAVNGKIYAIGGEATTARYLQQVDEYNPANDI